MIKLTCLLILCLALAGCENTPMPDSGRDFEYVRGKHESKVSPEFDYVRGKYRKDK